MIRPCGNRSRCGPARVGSGLDGLVDGSLQARLVSHDEQEIVRFPAPDLRGSCDVAGSSTLGVGGVAGDHGANSALTSAKLAVGRGGARAVMVESSPVAGPCGCARPGRCWLGRSRSTSTHYGAGEPVN
jgi:hypothetical protein